MLVVGNIHANDGRLLPGNVWYGVSLDEKKGINGGCVDGVKYFHCQDKCGVFVLAEKLQAAVMSANDIVLKTLLNGGKTTTAKLKKMTRLLLRVFLDYKGVELKTVETKDKLMSLTVKAMSAAASHVRVAEGMHGTSDGNQAHDDGCASSNDDSLILEDDADVAAGSGAVPDVVQHDLNGGSESQGVMGKRDASIEVDAHHATSGPDFLAAMGSAMLAEAPAANVVAVVGTAGIMDLETAAIVVNEGLATAGVTVPGTFFNTIKAIGEESSTTSSPGRAPSPRRVLLLTPEVLGITLESFAEAEIHDLEECPLTFDEVNGRVGAYMGKFARLIKECAAAAQSLVKGFE